VHHAEHGGNICDVFCGLVFHGKTGRFVLTSYALSIGTLPQPVSWSARCGVRCVQ
jgi:hypothetical protein